MSHIQERAMLAQLSISMWTARKQDRKVSAEVETAHGAHNAGRYNKDLVNKALLDPIKVLAGEVRAYHYKMTLPWSDAGPRLLPAKLFADYTTQLRALRSKFDALVTAMLTAYPAEVQAARTRLGTMYEPSDYPQVEDLKKSFGLTLEFNPMPSASDFRVDVGIETANEIRESITANVHSRQKYAIESTLARVKDVVSKIHERLSDPKALFRDTLIENAEDLCGVLDGLNITNDPLITQLERDIRAHLLKPPTLLRSSMSTRAAVAQKAQEILASLP